LLIGCASVLGVTEIDPEPTTDLDASVGRVHDRDLGIELNRRAVDPQLQRDQNSRTCHSHKRGETHRDHHASTLPPGSATRGAPRCCHLSVVSHTPHEHMEFRILTPGKRIGGCETRLQLLVHHALLIIVLYSGHDGCP
jgi:hypothetical protein